MAAVGENSLITESFQQGLSPAEAAARLSRFGPNELPQERPLSRMQEFTAVVKEPMLGFLLATAILYLALGSLPEGLMMIASAFLVIGLSYIQKRRSDRAVQALKDMTSPRALVIRDQIKSRISAAELVPGDLVLLSEGDRVPADGVIVESLHLRIDESLLTGESAPVDREFRDHVFSGTLVVGGRARVVVDATGSNTEVGHISAALTERKPRDLLIAKQTARTVRFFALAGLVLCVTVVLGVGLHRGQWISALLAGLATAIALLPEEFPVILSIFTAMGAWRLTRVNVLTRRTEAIERLGAITDLCVDKTGTLTLNEMRVARLVTASDDFLLPDDCERLTDRARDLVLSAAFASHVSGTDPMDRSLLNLNEELNVSDDRLARSTLLEEQVRARDGIIVTMIWHDPELDMFDSYLKGSPEAVLSECKLGDAESARVLETLENMANAGLRVLAVARKGPGEARPEWKGLIGFEDPIRPGVAKAVEDCHRAGINVIMITGDHPTTARSIASHAGIPTSHRVLSGLDLAAGRWNFDSVADARVFARMKPEQKLALVRTLKSKGRIVAMTGDGVNDAPSLKAADVGIAMGRRGTDVAREAADLVLTDDDFVSIVSGIKRGREIFANIRQAMAYVGSVHVPIAGLALIPAVLGWPLILLPAHIVFLELLIDPACSFLFESREISKDVMAQPPRSTSHPLFAGRDVARSLLQGALVLVGSLLLLAHLKGEVRSAEEIRGTLFIQLVLSNVGLIIADLSAGSMRALARVFSSGMNQLMFAAVLLAMMMIFAFEPASRLFEVVRPETPHLGLAIGTSIITTVLVAVWNRRPRQEK